jgi:hypothetical protein
MRAFELRVYTLRTKEALDFYVETVFARHLHNFSLFGVEAHGLWTAKDDVAHRAFALVSYGEGDDPGEVAKRYIQSPEAAYDTRDFNVADIVSVESTVLVPSSTRHRSDHDARWRHAHSPRCGLPLFGVDGSIRPSIDYS